MALGADEYTEIVTATHDNIQPDLYDQVLLRHPSLNMLRSEQSSDTGRNLVVNLVLERDGSTERSDASGTFSTSVSGDILGTAVYDWAKPIVSHIRIQWQRIKENEGKNEIVNLVNAHLEAMMVDHKKQLVDDLHALKADSAGNDATAAGQINSLDMIVSDSAYDSDPAGDGSVPAFKIGGIDASNEADWQASRIELPVDGDYSIRQAFRHLSNEVYVNTKSGSQVDTVIAGRDIFEEFEDSFDAHVRYQGTDQTGKSRFPTIQHDGLEITLDPDCPSKRAYFLNTDSLLMRSLGGTFMERQEVQKIEGTFDRVTPAASILATGTNERRANALLLRPDTAGGFA